MLNMVLSMASGHNRGKSFTSLHYYTTNNNTNEHVSEVTELTYIITI